MEDGLAPGPSKDPVTVVAGEDGMFGCEGEGWLGGRQHNTEEEEDNAKHVIVSCSSPDPPLMTRRTTLSPAQLPAQV